MAEPIMQIAHILGKIDGCDREIRRVNPVSAQRLGHIRPVLAGATPVMATLLSDGVVWDAFISGRRAVEGGLSFAPGRTPLFFASSGWRAAGPTPEGMIERGRTLIAEKPRDLRRREVGFFEILEREAAAQLIDNLGEGRAFGGQPARQCSDADAQRFGDRFHVSPAARQQPLELVLDRSAE